MSIEFQSTKEAELQMRKVELSQFEEIMVTYRFIHADFAEGLNYGVADKRFEEDGAYLAEHFKVPAIQIPKERTAESYLEFIWAYIGK